MAINLTNLFTKLGKLFYGQEIANTFRGTTYPAQINSIIDEYTSDSNALRAIGASVDTARTSMASGMSSAASSLKSSAQSTLIQVVLEDADLTDDTLTYALKELIAQMTSSGDDVDASTGAISASAITGNGDGTIVVSAKRGDGKNCENTLAETIRVECTSDTTPSTAGFTAYGDDSVSDKLSSDWPGGSGISRSLTAVGAASSLLTNGDMDDEDDRANTPDDWVLSVGTIGTTVLMTDYEVQRIVVTGPPLAGTYVVNWTNPAGKVQSTSPLAYNATGAVLQAALRLLEGLESVTVSTTGTTPLYTHDITFTGVAGNLTQITVTNNTTGGTYTPSTVTAGSANAYIGKALLFDSDGAELTCIQQRIDGLEALTQYAVNMWLQVDSVPAAGVLTIDLVDGIGGSVIADQAGTNNTFTVTCSSLTTSFVAYNGVFRIPKVVPALVYLRIRFTTAMSNTSTLAIDHVSLTEMTELYAGGPSAAIFSGNTPFTKGDSQTLADYWILTATNDRAGEIQEWFERNFEMNAKGLLLPSDSGGTETIGDALVA